MKVLTRAAAHFSQFVEDRTDSLLGTAYLLTRDRQAAEELVQDTLVALYPQWSRVAAAQSPIAYVRRSLINRYLNQQRRPAAGELVTDLVPQRQPGPDFAHRVDDRDQLRRVLSTLPPRQRAAVVLRYFHDLSDQQIAEAMGCRATTVRSLISRALSTLRGGAALTGLDGRSDQQGAVR
ncbi:SigE family RNA polymerase sigma factor [Jatrophihabitans sp.]|jgi:RNA polymerase sigma-70 factor (sigma-E family)|uniref:SigE family RNA polymerase sigma factor n=1 Tax=Jatrophihabitans sp. TaxID=1932789 RepID=UPI002F0CD1F0